MSVTDREASEFMRSQISAGQGEPLLILQGVSAYYADTPIIEQIDLTLHRNEIVTLIGPNGAGKSTLIKTALGIVIPDQGKVERRHKPVIGYVPQSIQLDPTLPISVDRFITLSPGSDHNESLAVLELVGAGNLVDQSMHEISGGEMRRVLLARALLRQPDILILDEPTAGVDVGGQASLYKLIQSVRDEFHCGVLLVSHDLHVVMAATDRVLCLNRHLCCSGKPEQVQSHPEYIALFGQQAAAEIGIYRHHHDHCHDLHGDICDHG